MENEKQEIKENNDNIPKKFKYFYTIEDFPKFKILEENYEGILNELLKVINEERQIKSQIINKEINNFENNKNNLNFFNSNKENKEIDIYNSNENIDKKEIYNDNLTNNQNYENIDDDCKYNYSQSSKIFEPWVEKNLYQESNEEGWDVAPLMIGGVKIPERIEKFPFLFSLVSKINGVISVSFSLLKPGTHIVPHKGYDDYSEKMFRYHMGMIVPEGDIGIRVEKEIRKWENGKSFVFDDFLIHEAWNFTTSNRIVLIIDFLKDETKLPNNIKFFDANFNKSVKGYLNNNNDNSIDGNEDEDED